MVVEITRDNFEEVTSGDRIVLVDCWAPWCRGCGDFETHFRQAAARHPSHLFGTLDTQDQKNLRDALRIRHVPSLLLYRDEGMSPTREGVVDYLSRFAGPS